MKIMSALGLMLLLVLIFSFYAPVEKTGYIQLQTVFQSFEGKIEMEKRFQQTQWNTQKYLDSLQLQLRQMKLSLEQKESDKLKNDIQNLKTQYTNIENKAYQIQSEKAEEYTQQIWNQLNQYIEDFGQENDYDYIFGTEGAGVLMYGDEKRNLTKDIINYINKRYDGN